MSVLMEFLLFDLDLASTRTLVTCHGGWGGTKGEAD